MRGGRKQIFLGLGLVMVMGLAVYLRLWTIDYNFSSSETELLRCSLRNWRTNWGC
ncbi:hypothetical protein KY289_035467 [Solanum tuberosum]|nr:hypothetical protein KY289_035467 [Solanum tuberosum]